MSGKRAVAALLAALVAFGYVFTMNPGMVDFRIYPGTTVSTSLALVLFLFFLAGVGVAALTTAFKEAARSFWFWRHRKGEERRDEARRLLVRGRGHAALGRTRDARKLMARAHRKAAGEPLIAIEMARAELADGQDERAEQRLQALLHEDSRNPEVLGLLLEIYRARGDYEGQVATLTRRLELDPDHLATLRSLRDLYRDAENWTEAVRTQERVLARTDGRAGREAERRTLSELRLRRARALGPQRAREILVKITEEDEPFAPAHDALGETLEALGDREGAVQRWLKGYHATGQVGLLLRVEEARRREGQAAEMLKLYKKLGKKGGAASLLRGRLLLELERTQEALECLEGADPRAAGSRTGRLLVGEALYRLRSFDEAARAFREAAAGGGGAPPLAFTCRDCGATVAQWGGRCPKCGAYDRLDLDLGAVPPVAPVPAVG